MNKNPLILIVEDEEAISNFMSAVLTSNNYNLIKTGKGKEALSLAASYCPDLILLDLGLPDLDGIEVIKSIREWTNIPIIVVSARGHEREKVEALDLGADDYITKPFGTSELLARIRTEIRHSQKKLNGLHSA
ncbi:MAG TPA: response regulator, partial [Anaerovoracaceae bacterium]|nr:response regulator [Anaerovoracaceae bacterium]